MKAAAKSAASRARTSALAWRSAASPCKGGDVFLGAIEISLGLGDRSAVHERILDGGDATVGPNARARMERMGIDIPTDRR